MKKEKKSTQFYCVFVHKVIMPSSVFTGALIHLKPILEDGSDAEKQESASIVWELAFDKGNKQQMKVIL